MKVEAIVYVSNTGFTKRYAMLLSEATGLPAYERKEAGKLKKGADILYMGWIMAGIIRGYKKAAKRYHVRAVAGVGMAAPADKSAGDVVIKYGAGDVQAFFLQGGFDKSKLRGLNKMMMNNMENMAAKKEQKTEEDLRMLEICKNGMDHVKAENLNAIISWMK